MIRFIIQGLWRDKSRSRLPILVVAIGVTLTVFMHSYVTGVMTDSLEQTAKFQSGHVRVMTKAYADNLAQNPTDLGLLQVSSIIQNLQTAFPEMQWTPRIKFGGLVDVPDNQGETKAQGQAVGFAFDLLSPESKEIQRLKLNESLVKGQLPQNAREIILSDLLAQNLNLEIGDSISLITTTINGSMSVMNFVLSGTIRFGMTALDRGTIITDLSSARNALDFEDGAGEILGFFSSGFYEDDKVKELENRFAVAFPPDESDPYHPIMHSLRDDKTMSVFIDMANYMAFIISFIFIIAMSLVLWNAGLLGGLRRYGEFGVRLAIGEEKRHLYISLLTESFFVGIAGTIAGTAIGLGFAWLLQVYGLNIEEFSKASQSSLMMPTVLRSRITPSDFYIGFFPGVLSTLVGAALSGIGIYKRKTAQLFKELE